MLGLDRDELLALLPLVTLGFAVVASAPEDEPPLWTIHLEM